MDAQPRFRRNTTGYFIFANSSEAIQVSRQNRLSGRPDIFCLKPEAVKKNAQAYVKSHGGDITNELLVLGHYKLQFGQYRGQTFKWMLENGLGYAIWLVSSMKGGAETSAPLNINKNEFKRYVESFTECQEELRKKLEPSKPTPLPSTSTAFETTAPGVIARPTRFNPSIGRKMSLFNLGVKVKQTSCSSPRKKIKSSTQTSAIAATSTTATTATTSAASGVEDTPFSEPTVPLQSHTAVSPTAESSTFSDNQEYPLPVGWRTTLPKADHKWVSEALFKWSKTGRVKLDESKLTALWFYPPQPELICSQPPEVDQYFCSRLFVWMPRRLWGIILYCPYEGCQNKKLISAGIYRRVRQVLDIDGYYSMAGEYYQCTNCTRKVISWSHALVQQIDIGRRLQFPAIMTYRYACDMKIVRLLRRRGLGNSTTQLQKKLEEQHGETWTRNTFLYLTNWENYSAANADRLGAPFPFEQYPFPRQLPRPNWFMVVYCKDILMRLPEVKASITSVYGRILKLNSTKKVVKKLVGYAAGTALCATNVGNERGEVLISVLTSDVGYGLTRMVGGLIKRYKQARVQPPKILYVNNDCCNDGLTRKLFSAWPNLQFRLDILHFMKRFAVCCTSSGHIQFETFMSRLSLCIFQWCSEDLNKLVEAKRPEIEKLMDNPTDSDVIKHITKKELALHCRRKTRGVEETLSLLHELIATFTVVRGTGAPLLDKDKAWQVLATQKQHIKCIQDPENIELYTKTGTLTKGGVELPVYRCGRGTTSLESFQLHMGRFIPGTSAGDVNFQAFLLEGLSRWNQDRAHTALEKAENEPRTYNNMLKHELNELSSRIFGKKLVPSYVQPREYTGELIGVEYLYSQRGQVLQYMTPEEDYDDDGDFVDVEDAYADLEDDVELEDPTIALLTRQDLQEIKQQSSSLPVIETPSCSSQMPDVMPELSEQDTAQQCPSRSSFSDAPSSPRKSVVTNLMPELTCQETLSFSRHQPLMPDAMPQLTREEPIQQAPRALFSEDADEDLEDDVELEDPTIALPTKQDLQEIKQQSSTSLPVIEIPSCSSQLPGVADVMSELSEQDTAQQCPSRSSFSDAPSSSRKSVVTDLMPELTRQETLSFSRHQPLTPDAMPQLTREEPMQQALRALFSETRPCPRSKTVNKSSKSQSSKKSNYQLPSSTITSKISSFPSSTITSSQIGQKHNYQLPSSTITSKISSFPSSTITSSQMSSPPLQIPVVQISPPIPVLTVLPPTDSQQRKVTPRALFPKPCTPQLPYPLPVTENLSISQIRYRKRKLQEEKAGMVRRKYDRKATTMTCKRCLQPRRPNDHQQYYGNWYCTNTAIISYEEWLEELERKYQKKKT